MKRWGTAGAALAAAALLVGVATIGMGLRSVGGQGGDGQSSTHALDGGSDASRRLSTGAAREARIVLPVLRADTPSPLTLTRSMLEQAWQDTRLEVRLPDGGGYTVALESERLDPGSQWTLVGRVDTRLGPQAMVVTVGPEAVFGVLPHPDGSMMQITTSNGSTSIAAAGGILPPGSKDGMIAEPDYLIPHESDRWAAAKAGALRLPEDRPAQAWPTKTLSIVDIVVLGLYTDDLVELRGSVSAAETEVTNLFAIANQSHIDSGTRVRLQLAGLKQIGIDPVLNNNDALHAITNNNVHGVDLHQLRDEMAADLVALLRPYRDTHGSCGVAWLNGAGRSPQGLSDYFGMSVSNVAPCGPHVLAHELGHNMGSAHDRETDSINGQLQYGAYPYSFGYRQDGPLAFATIMAYSNGQPWLGYFSNPNSRRCGTACGVEGRADNVRSLNTTAPTIANFRGPPGTLSIVDAEIHEQQPGELRHLVFPVRLSGVAPAGGVSFEVLISDGTAQAGVDYIAQGPRQGTIPAGQRETNVTVEIIGDTLEEPDETILLRLTNVIGATVHKGEAVGTILNDDPRLTLSGRIRFEGAPPPVSEFTMLVSGAEGTYTSEQVTLSPPDFRYVMPVIKGASVSIAIDAPPPFAILPLDIEDIGFSINRDIRLKRGVQISGQLRLPADVPAITTPLTLEMSTRIANQQQMILHIQLEPPDFRYTRWIVPGAWVYMELKPASPYKRFMAIHPNADSDFVQDINLSSLPGLVIWGVTRQSEGAAGMTDSIQFVVQLSDPAPAGGVSFRYRTLDGTATAGDDYAAIHGTLEIPEGSNSAYTESITWFGDDQLEGDEYFYIEVSDVVGANPVVTRQKIVLAEQERHMSEPLPARPVR